MAWEQSQRMVGLEAAWSLKEPSAPPEVGCAIPPVLEFDKSGPQGSITALDMQEYCLSAVELYKELPGVVKLKEASAPFWAEGSLSVADDEVAGELSRGACNILMKDFWLARLARPDLCKPICFLASHASAWSRNGDKRLYRLMCFMDSCAHYRLIGRAHGHQKC